MYIYDLVKLSKWLSYHGMKMDWIVKALENILTLREISSMWKFKSAIKYNFKKTMLHTYK